MEKSRIVSSKKSRKTVTTKINNFASMDRVILSQLPLFAIIENTIDPCSINPERLRRMICASDNSLSKPIHHAMKKMVGDNRISILSNTFAVITKSTPFDLTQIGH